MQTVKMEQCVCIALGTISWIGLVDVDGLVDGDLNDGLQFFNCCNQSIK